MANSKTKGISKDRAEALARRAVATLGPNLVLTGTHEHTFGWVFGYEAPGGPPLGGNAPLIVDRRTGTVHVTGTSRPLEIYLEAFRRFGPEAFDRREWEAAIARQERRKGRADTTARREGKLAWGAEADHKVDWDEVARELLDGPTDEEARELGVITERLERSRCYYCDVFVPPAKAAQTARGLACPRCFQRETGGST